MAGFFYKLKRMKKRWWVLIGVGLVILIMILANLLNPNRNAKMVMVEEAKRGDIIETVSGPGTVKAKSEVSISTYVLSRVIDIAVEEGQEVKKGELLVQLDDTQYREEVVRASAGVRSAEAALEIAERQLVEGRETFDRQRSLYEDGLISKAEYDRSLTTYSSLETAYRQALSNLEQARALLVAAQDNLSKTRYTSPIDGVVTRINVEEGEVVVPGTMNIAGTEMMVISNMGVMEVEAEID
ncbi:MAG TPA: HlyD family secretion protein, partial [Firmicutes bacterium]|nr:HlyD family secretion protein [Bacillota bacterium]